MEENLNDSISVHHFFIYKNDKLVGYTTELSYLKCYIKHRKKLLPEEEFNKYKVLHVTVNENTSDDTINILKKYDNQDNKYELVMQNGSNTFFISSQDESIMIDYDNEYVSALRDVYETVVDLLKYIKLTDYEKEKVKKFKESMDQIMYDIYESDEDLGEGVFDIFGLFTELLKLGVIS